MKLLLKDVKPAVAKILSMASTDSRVTSYINEAQERLIYKGKWPGTYVRYAINESDGVITWPRQLETIEAVAVAGSTGRVRNSWYEFQEAGPGLLNSTNSGDSLTLVDRGDACSWSDITTTDTTIRRIRIKYDSADNGKTMVLQGYNGTTEWIRTSSGGVIIDGENITFDTSADTNEAGTTYYQDTTNTFQFLSAVIRDASNYSVNLYEIDSTGTATEVTASERQLAVYEPTETRPIYRRSLIPGLPDTNTTQVVTVVGKARFVPAVNDNDWLFINYESAVKEMVMSIRHAENNQIQEAEAYEARAVRMLEEQLMHYIGDGTVIAPRMQGVAAPTAAGVENII
jgi:hypothetical protein